MRSHPPRPTASVRVSSVFAASDSVGTAPRPSRSSGDRKSTRLELQSRETISYAVFCLKKKKKKKKN